MWKDDMKKGKLDNLESAIEQAFSIRKNAYAPYSHFKVGAALVTTEGKIYKGCNIENAAFTPGNCAERTAFFKAVSEGERNFSYIVVTGGEENLQSEMTDYCPPCGVCLQVMMEFCQPETFQVVAAKSKTDYKVFLLKELLPQGFGAKFL